MASRTRKPSPATAQPQQQPPQQKLQKKLPPMVKQFRPEHVTAATGWRDLIERKIADIGQLERQLQQARADLQTMQESFSMWLAASYGLHPERGESWHLDLPHLHLIWVNRPADEEEEQQQEPTPEEPQDDPASAPD